eukprot:1591619-Ditylum_brightwellii.AAC.1
MKEKKEEKGSKSGKKKYQLSNNFKIALSSMLSDKDFKTLGPANAALHLSMGGRDMDDSSMVAHQTINGSPGEKGH